jgi:hypothetical protein
MLWLAEFPRKACLVFVFGRLDEVEKVYTPSFIQEW